MITHIAPEVKSYAGSLEDTNPLGCPCHGQRMTMLGRLGSQGVSDKLELELGNELGLFEGMWLLIAPCKAAEASPAGP